MQLPFYTINHEPRWKSGALAPEYVARHVSAELCLTLPAALL